MINIKQIKVEVSKNSDEMIKKGIAKKINIPFMMSKVTLLSGNL